MSLRTSTITSTVKNEREKDKVPGTAKGRGPKDHLCEYTECCKRFPTMNKIVSDELKKTESWNASMCGETSPANGTTKYALKGKTYNWCSIHGALIKMLEHKFSEERTDNRSSERDPDETTNDAALNRIKLDFKSDEGKLNPEVDNSPSKVRAQALRGEYLIEALSGAEINAGPAVRKPWTSDMSIEDGDQYHNWSGTWRRAWLARETLDNIQGRQVLNLEDTSFLVVFFVHGYSNDQSIVFITVPSVEAQYEIPRNILQDDEHGEWHSEPMLLTTLHSSTFVDGMSSTGNSMFKPTSVPTLSSSIDELAAESPVAKGDDYKASSNTWKEVAGDFDEVSRGEQGRNSYSSPGRTDRRGVGTVPMRGSLLEQMNGSFKIGGQQVESAYPWSKREQGPEMQNPEIRAPSSAMRGLRVEPSVAQTGHLRGT
jgi:hypothetical protein